MSNQSSNHKNNKTWAWIKQHKLLLLVIILFLILNNISYIMGFWQASQEPDLVYTATPYTNRADHFVYLSHVEQGKEGHLFTKLLYNHLAENNVLFSPHWYVIGQFSKITGISSPASYFIFRIIFLIGFLFVLWWFVKNIFSDYKKIHCGYVGNIIR